jgi:hypothetical protein
MKAFISERAKKELDEMNSELAEAFLVHIEKLLGMPPRRHLKHGENLQVLHCFSSHKEYERWYKSYK